MDHKLSTQIDGLDRLLSGGFVLPPKEKSGLVILICGKPGTGKTTLALQIANASLDWVKPGKSRGFETLYLTLDQTEDDIRSKIKDIRNRGKSRDDIEILSYVAGKYSESDREKPFGTPESATESALKVHNHLVKKKLTSSTAAAHNLTIVDGLNCIGNNDKREYIQLGGLIHLLRKTSRVSILVYEPIENEDAYVEYLADMTIYLKGEVETGPINYFFHSMCITKSRYQSTALGWHKYKIRKNGIEVYPSIHFHVHRRNYLEEQVAASMKPMSKQYGKSRRDAASSAGSATEICDEAIITRIVGNIKQGSSTVLFGPRRTSKSQITMDFLRSKHEHGLLLSLIDNQDTIIQQAACQRSSCPKFKNKSCRQCFEKVFLLHLRPGCISPEEFFHFLSKRLDDGKNENKLIKRLVFWDLTQLEFRFPLLSSEPMFLPALIDFLKQYTFQDKDGNSGVGISSLFMAAANTKLSAAASAMADNVIFCWRDSVKDGVPEKFVKSTRITEKMNEFLVIYVDRAEGITKTKERELFCFPIDNPKSPLKDFRLEVQRFKTAEIDWLKRASQELQSIDQLQGVPK